MPSNVDHCVHVGFYAMQAMFSSQKSKAKPWKKHTFEQHAAMLRHVGSKADCFIYVHPVY